MMGLLLEELLSSRLAHLVTSRRRLGKKA